MISTLILNLLNSYIVRFEKFLAQPSESELEKFDDIYSDAKWLEGKTARKNNGKTEVEPTPGNRVYVFLEFRPPYLKYFFLH